MLIPPEASAGKNLRTSNPLSSPFSISVGVQTPGIIGTLFSTHQSTVASLKPGETINCAPALTAFLANSTLVTVPAPTNMLGYFSEIFLMLCSAAAVLKVTSAQLIPPSSKALASPQALSASSNLTTGTIPML